MSNHNFSFFNINDALPVLCRELFTIGSEFDSRAGKTLELTQVSIRLKEPLDREIVIPDRKANIAAQIVETMWVLSGRNDVAGLLHYLPRAADFSDDGKTWRAGYGPRLRDYHGTDQLAYVVDTLSANPDSRQAVAMIWDPTEDTQPGKDIACNNWLSFSAREGVLDLTVGIRSNDLIWGFSGINAFEWSTLLELVAVLTGLTVGSLHFATTSLHMYEQHWGKGEKLMTLDGNFMYTRSPRLELSEDTHLRHWDELCEAWFDLEEKIRFGYDVEWPVNEFPDPMLRSWLRVLQWYWSGDEKHLDELRNTSIRQACLVGMKPPAKPQVSDGPFLDFVNELHRQKHAAYGDSWKRRGEYMILANIARKVDRLEGGKDTPDETQADTAIDLMVYLAKTLCWYDGGSGDPDEVVVVLRRLNTEDKPSSGTDLSAAMDDLFAMAEARESTLVKKAWVDGMLRDAYQLAKGVWGAQG